MATPADYSLCDRWLYATRAQYEGFFVILVRTRIGVGGVTVPQIASLGAVFAYSLWLYVLPVVRGRNKSFLRVRANMSCRANLLVRIIAIGFFGTLAWVFLLLMNVYERDVVAQWGSPAFNSKDQQNFTLGSCLYNKLMSSYHYWRALNTTVTPIVSFLVMSLLLQITLMIVNVNYSGMARYHRIRSVSVVIFVLYGIANICLGFYVSARRLVVYQAHLRILDTLECAGAQDVGAPLPNNPEQLLAFVLNMQAVRRDMDINIGYSKLMTLSETFLLAGAYVFTVFSLGRECVASTQRIVRTSQSFVESYRSSTGKADNEQLTPSAAEAGLQRSKRLQRQLLVSSVCVALFASGRAVLELFEGLGYVVGKSSACDICSSCQSPWVLRRRVSVGPAMQVVPLIFAEPLLTYVCWKLFDSLKVLMIEARMNRASLMVPMT